jgi:hypothetical protein
MATRNLILVDQDGDPPTGGSVLVSVDYDDVSLLVTLVRYQNTTVADASLTITQGARSRNVALPAGTPPSTIAPPFSPGNWTPAMQANPDSGPPFIAAGWSVSLTTTRPRRP